MELLQFAFDCLVSACDWSLFQLFVCSLGVLWAFRFFFRLAGASRKDMP